MVALTARDNILKDILKEPVKSGILMIQRTKNLISEIKSLRR